MYLYYYNFKQGSLDNDINQDFQDAIDVMQRHSEIFYYDTGSLKIYPLRIFLLVSCTCVCVCVF